MHVYSGPHISALDSIHFPTHRSISICWTSGKGLGRSREQLEDPRHVLEKNQPGDSGLERGVAIPNHPWDWNRPSSYTYMDGSCSWGPCMIMHATISIYFIHGWPGHGLVNLIKLIETVSFSMPLDAKIAKPWTSNGLHHFSMPLCMADHGRTAVGSMSSERTQPLPPGP